MKLFAALLAALAFALCAAPADATPVTLATHYTPDQLHAFCAKVDGNFSAGAHYTCTTICDTQGDACGVFCGTVACLALAPVRLSTRTTPYLVLEPHSNGLLSAGSTDPWVIADKKDPKPKPPPPPKDVLDGTDGGGPLGGVKGESKDDVHKDPIEIMSIGSGSGSGGGGGGNAGGSDSSARSNPPSEHSPSTGGSGGGAPGPRAPQPGSMG